MIKSNTLSTLENGKNLLAYSAGVDSSALFHLLLENNIPFDIAIVHYNLRPEAIKEYHYAQEIAKKFQLNCYTLDTHLENKNIEMSARNIRYDFFEKLIKTHHYTNLLTAHQLNDKTEWFLMQFAKGSSLHEMVGMQESEQRENYTLIRPLLHVSRESLYNYLHVNNHHFFEDDSNSDSKYTRNVFRTNVSNFLIHNYADGIAKSFEYLQEDVNEVFAIKEFHSREEFFYFESYDSRHSTIKMIDIILKKLGTLIHQGDRTRLKKETSLVIARKYSVSITERYCFIAPYITVSKMDKKFKEKCRVLKIDTLLRGYLFQEPELFSEVCDVLESQ